MPINILNSSTVCMVCRSERLIGHGRNEQVIRDIPTHGKRVAIYVNTRRWRCQARCVITNIQNSTVIDTLPNRNKDTVAKYLLQMKHRRGLMHDRFVLLKRQRDLTDKEAFNLDGWARNYPVLGEAYRLKEAFYGVYEASTGLARYESLEQERAARNQAALLEPDPCDGPDGPWPQL